MQERCEFGTSEVTAQFESRWSEDCPCAACRHSRGYLRHLFLPSREMLGPVLTVDPQPDLLSAVTRGRLDQAITEADFAEFHCQRLRGWGVDAATEHERGS